MEQLVINQFKLLPEPLQLEVLHYIQYLLQYKYQKAAVVSAPIAASSGSPVRQPGWGKHIFLYVAPDFAATPEGFEAYMPTA